MLPVPNRDTLEMLLKLLDKVRQHSDVNRMDAFNLAMVFGPNLLKKHKLNNMPTSFKSGNASHTSTSSMHGSAIDKYNLIDDIDSVISATKYLIENQHLIFSVSHFKILKNTSSLYRNWNFRLSQAFTTSLLKLLTISRPARLIQS